MGQSIANEITLKNMAIKDIVETFDENIPFLKAIFETRAHIPNRFNIGNGLDYLTILYHTVAPAQQQEMYTKIVQQFVKDEEKYLHDLRVSFRRSLISRDI